MHFSPFHIEIVNYAPVLFETCYFFQMLKSRRRVSRHSILIPRLRSLEQVSNQLTEITFKKEISMKNLF